MKKIAEWVLYITSLFPLYLLLLIQSINLSIRWENINFKHGIIIFILNVLSNIKRILLINYFNNNFTRNISMWLISILLFLSLLVVRFVSKKYNHMIYNKEKDVTKPELSLKKNTLDRVDTMSYVGTYIVPLLTINVNSVRSLVLNVVLLIILGKFYVMNEQVFVNPLFNLGGFGIYRSMEKYYITKDDIEIILDKLDRKHEVFTLEIMPNLYLIKAA